MRELPAGRAGVAGTSVLVPAGPFVLGVDAATEPFSLDNERPAHVVDVPAFRIGRVPVTNAEWRAFIDDGGYRRPELWSERGWEHRQQADLTAPQFWNADGTRTRFGHVENRARRRTRAARHVLRSARRMRRGRARGCPPRSSGRRPAPGTRAPTRGGATRGERSRPRRSYANLGGDALRPAPVGAYPQGASAYGAEQMLGDVWEWTTSPLRPWPGFTPMIYDRYSEPFFDGDYRVLRGGSWAVAPDILRPSFRNWDHPIRRQIFSGVRLAWDV